MIHGPKYELTKDLDVAEIAKLLRKDIKGRFPSIKSSVRIDRYSMGQSINVYLSEFGKLEPHVVKSVVQDLMNCYNFDDSDPMTDYFRVRFYGFVSLA